MSARSTAQGTVPWPGDDTLVQLAAQHRTMTGVARACGKSRESLRDWLRLRPALKARMLPFLPVRVTDTEHDQLRVAIRRDRRARRKQARRGDPESREYETILRGGPCFYPGCVAPVEVTDHIHPYKLGGIDHWSNYSGGCAYHNGRKNGTPLLQFLLADVLR